MGLFTDIYNTVAKFFRPQEEQGDASKSVATNRLKLVLMQDRTNLTPKILEQMRGELIDLLSRYVELDKELLELNFEHEGDQVALMLSIPVIRAKDEEEIEWGKQKRIVTVNQLDSDKRIVHEGDDSPYAYLKPLKYQESDNNLPICNRLSSFFKVNKDIFTNSDVDCFLFIKEPKTETIPVKFQICNNTLFILKKNKFDSIVLLKGKTFIMTNSQKVVIFKEQVYYSFTFQFQYCVEGTELSVIFKEEKVFKAFIAKIKNLVF